MAKIVRGIVAFTFMAVIAHGTPVVAGGGEEGSASLSPLVVSATGYGTAAEKVSSDVTVITAEDISHMPAHNMDEALNYITGLQLDRSGGPGTPVMPSIQGSDYSHVKVLVDDIPLDYLSGSPVDLSTLPLDNVERVEILKGAASSSWGSTMGGVINIITKKPTEKFQAEGGTSVGENETHRYNAGVSGTVHDVGYVLTADRFETDGFFDNQNAMTTNIYGKLVKQINTELKAEASYGYSKIDRRYSDTTGYFLGEDTYEHRGKFLLTYSPQKELELSLSGYDRQFDTKYEENSPWFFPTGNGIGRDKENIYGALLKAVWRHSNSGTLSAGAEDSHGYLVYNGGWYGDVDTSKDRRDVFANETLELGDLNINLGIRYDDDSKFGSETSPSAGLVYKLAHDTFFRINAARGFTTPSIIDPLAGLTPNKDLTAERAWSYQAGVESGIIPYLWGKVTFYRADITDAIDAVYDESGNLLYMRNIDKLRRQGVEADLKTREYKGLSLSGGYAFNDIKDLQSDEVVKGQARIIYNAGVDYKGPYETRTTVNGHWVWWNADESWNAKDKTWVWDAKVSKYLAKWKYAIGEVFIAVHNFTDEKQYWADLYPNPRRWVEAGISLTTF